MRTWTDADTAYMCGGVIAFMSLFQVACFIAAFATGYMALIAAGGFITIAVCYPVSKKFQEVKARCLVGQGGWK